MSHSIGDKIYAAVHGGRMGAATRSAVQHGYPSPSRRHQNSNGLMIWSLTGLRARTMLFR
jgi:hypothetical protein